MSRHYGKTQRNKLKKNVYSEEIISSSSNEISDKIPTRKMHLPCKDCGKNTSSYDKDLIARKNTSEYFMVNNNVWYKALGDDENLPRTYFCIDCIEKRLGRELCREDFSTAPINRNSVYDSPALKKRKGENFKIVEARDYKSPTLYEGMIEIDPEDQGKYIRHLARMYNISVDEVIDKIYSGE